MEKFKNYKEMEDFMDRECIETYTDYVRRDLEEAIEKKWHELMEKAKYSYIVVEHPHRGKAEIYVIRGYKDDLIYDSYERDNDLFETYKYLQQTDIFDAIKQCFDLWDLNSFEIYNIEELRKDYTLAEAVEYIYKGQSYHNRLSKEQIEEEIHWLWS